jgi:hypothetical protein
MSFDSFTLVCLLIRGNVRYDADYVVKLRSMVRRNTAKDFNTVCLTDGSFDLPPDIDTFRIKPMPAGERGFWRKPRVFLDHAPEFARRILYMDLDVLVVANIDAIIDYPAEFAICADSAPDFQGLGGKVCVKGYNSSVMVWNKGKRRYLAQAEGFEYRRRLFSDQDAYKEIAPNEATFPANWIRRLSAGGPETWDEETRVILCIGEKNHKAQKSRGWFDGYWR